MNMRCRDAYSAVHQCTRRASILDDNHLKTEIRGCAHRGIHAHVGHHATNHDALSLPAFEQSQQISLAKAVRKLLVRDGLTFEMRHQIMNTDTVRARDKKGRTRLA